MPVDAPAGGIDRGVLLVVGPAARPGGPVAEALEQGVVPNYPGVRVDAVRADAQTGWTFPHGVRLVVADLTAIPDAVDRARFLDRLKDANPFPLADTAPTRVAVLPAGRRAGKSAPGAWEQVPLSKLKGRVAEWFPPGRRARPRAPAGALADGAGRGLAAVVDRACELVDVWKLSTGDRSQLVHPLNQFLQSFKVRLIDEARAERPPGAGVADACRQAFTAVVAAHDRKWSTAAGVAVPDGFAARLGEYLDVPENLRDAAVAVRPGELLAALVVLFDWALPADLTAGRAVCRAEDRAGRVVLLVERPREPADRAGGASDLDRYTLDALDAHGLLDGEPTDIWVSLIFDRCDARTDGNPL